MKLFSKKLLTVLLSVILVFGVFSASFITQSRTGYFAIPDHLGDGKPYPGDINFDSSVDAIDALLVLQYTVGYPNSNIDSLRADVNGDGQINATDALRILQYAIGLVDVFEAYPAMQSMPC